jgi:hypothetical protein
MLTFASMIAGHIDEPSLIVALATVLEQLPER